VSADVKLLICNISRSVQGGVENIVADLCRNLPAYGIDPVVGLAKGLRHNRPERYRAAFPDLPTVEIDGTGGTRQARIEGLVRTIRSVRPDIALIARVYDAYEAISRFKARDARLRLAVTIQAYEPHYIYDARLFREHIDLCVTSGELVRSAVCDWAGLPADRVVSIPGGVRPPLRPVGERHMGEPVRLGYVGRLDPDQKRALDLIPFTRSLERLGVPFTLAIVGGGPAESALREALGGQVAHGSVEFWGWRSPETLYEEVYPNLHIFVHFAHTEGVTIAPREAMAHGAVPVVSDFVGRAQEGQFIDDVNALIFPVGDVDAAARRVARIVKEADLYERLSRAAASSQQDKYSYHGAIEAWAQAFRKCLERPQARGAPVRPAYAPDGRLARWGVDPWLAQRLRNLVGARHMHADGSGEWPTGSGTMTADAAAEIMAPVSERLSAA